MSIDVTIIPPPGFPDPQEPVSSFARVPGNIMTAPEVLGYRSLDDIPDREVAKAILIDVITEIDKDDVGRFSDQWCVDADLRWSGGKEMREAYRQIAPYMRPGIGPSYMQSERAYWGRCTRDRLRQEAIRFLLYYLAGYEVRWSP